MIDIFHKVKSKHVLEVGILICYPAILMTKNLDSDDWLITIEINGDEAMVAQKNIEGADMPPNVEVLVWDLKKVIPQLKGSFGLIFLDATKRVSGLPHEGDVIVADNAGMFRSQIWTT